MLTQAGTWNGNCQWTRVIAGRDNRAIRGTGAQVSRIRPIRRRCSHRSACLPKSGIAMITRGPRPTNCLSPSHHLVEQNNQSATDTPMITGLQLRRLDKTFPIEPRLISLSVLSLRKQATLAVSSCFSEYKTPRTKPSSSTSCEKVCTCPTAHLAFYATTPLSLA
jgi:hypothetical protein